MGENRALDPRETDSMIHNAHDLRNQPQRHDKNLQYRQRAILLGVSTG